MRFFQVPGRCVQLAFAALGLLIAWQIIGPALFYAVEYLVTLGITDAGTTFVLGYLFDNLTIASAIPACVVCAWVFYKQGFGWLTSVVGRIRWRWLGITTGIRSGQDVAGIAECGLDPKSSTESFHVAPQRRNLSAVDVATLDSRDTVLPDPQIPGERNLCQCLGLTNLTELPSADLPLQVLNHRLQFVGIDGPVGELLFKCDAHIVPFRLSSSLKWLA